MWIPADRKPFLIINLQYYRDGQYLKCMERKLLVNVVDNEVDKVRF